MVLSGNQVEMEETEESKLDESTSELLKYLQTEHAKGDQSDHLVHTYTDKISIFYHNNVPELLVLFDSDFKGLETIPQIDAWVKMSKKNSDDSQVVTHIERLLKVGGQILMEFELVPPSLLSGLQNEEALREYLTDPVNKMIMYHGVFNAYSEVNAVGFQVCNLTLASFGYIMVNGDFNQDGHYDAPLDEAPEYNFFFTQIGGLLPLTENCPAEKDAQTLEKIQSVHDPKRLSGTTASEEEKPNVELYSLAFSILEMESLVFSAQLETQNDEKDFKEAKTLERTAGSQNTALGDDTEFQTLFESGYEVPYRPEGIQDNLENVSFGDGLLDKAVGVQHPVLYAKLEFLVSNARIMVLDLIHKSGAQKKSVFTNESIYQDLKYVGVCMEYFFEYQNRKWEDKSVMFRGDKMNGLKKLVEIYADFIGFVVQMMVGDYSMRMSAKEMADLLAIEIAKAKELINELKFPNFRRLLLI